MPRPSQPKSAAQLTFPAVNGWGGKRRGAGRKNKSGTISHARRSTVNFRKPLHLTIKIKEKTCNLRCKEVATAFKSSAKGARKFGLRIFHYSLLKDHLHILVEAQDNDHLTRGMRSFGARFAKAIRKLVGGRGSIFKGRFHLQVIQNPTQMRNSLIYVLQNFANHSKLLKHVDRYSSAVYFRDWRQLLGRRTSPLIDELNQFDRKKRRNEKSNLPDYLCAPRSWLAREGWTRAPLLR